MRRAALFLFVAVLMVPIAAKSDVTDRDARAQPKVPAAKPLPLPESGDSAESVFREIGMFGTWATDCGRPASLDNPYVSVTTPSAGLVLENNDVGPEYAANRYSVLSARRLPRRQLEVNVIFRPGAPGEERQTLVFHMGKGTRRTIFNRVDGGEVRVKNGVVLSRGIKTPVLRKCN
jgi:hypothetical protein